MTQPLKSGEPGRSEFSHGRGMAKHPDSDYQSQRKLPWKTEVGKGEGIARKRAELRSDPTNAQENILPDMYYALGNPDMFGPEPPLVRESVQNPPANYPQPVLRYGVDREG